jgi:hypothetical protein
MRALSRILGSDISILGRNIFILIYLGFQRLRGHFRGFYQSLAPDRLSQIWKLNA